MIYKGACHCGHVRFEVDGDLSQATIYDCNCSICSKSAYLHWYVQPEQVRLLTLKVAVATYWGRGMAGGHHFCPVCGVPLLRTSIQFPPPLSVNVRCLDGVDFSALKIAHNDGKKYR